MLIELTNRDIPKATTYVDPNQVTGIRQLDQGTYVSLSGGDGQYVSETPKQVADLIEKARKPKK